MSKTDTVAWPFSVQSTLFFVIFDLTVLLLVGTVIAYGWSPV